jgi:uncharacterized protein (DUF924 family)
MQDPISYQDILKFWFEELEPKDWFKGGDAIDQSIRERFEPVLEPVHKGEYRDWLDTAQGRLASIIVLDQFPRNLYRGQARSFSYDERALELSLEGISRGLDLQLEPLLRVFFYLPLEHSEVMEDQDLSIERFAHLVTRVDSEQAETFRGYLHYAWRHYEIIKRFGRYPHRNEILGRESTPKELNFLKEPGSSFL